jgi:hypothetical protein
MPQTPSSYEAMPLFLVPRTRAEYIVLAVGATLADIVHEIGGADFARRNAYGWVSLSLFCYLPALVMVLRRPNESAAAELRAAALGRGTMLV